MQCWDYSTIRRQSAQILVAQRNEKAGDIKSLPLRSLFSAASIINHMR
jgi:hypothetical protein